MIPTSVVAIGLSAGGLKPLKTFFDHTPLDSTAYVVLSHLLPAHKSELQTILQRHSALQMQDVLSDTILQSDHVYVLRENSYVKVANNILQLNPRKGAYPNLAIDIFLESLSLHYNFKKAAIILSGGGSDGTNGIGFIKSANGLVIAQTPASCEHEWMPKNAISSGHVDYISLPEDMPTLVSEWSKR